MSHYTQFTEEFKNVSPDAQTAKFRRDTKIWHMLLNRLGIPETLHEPITAIFITGNWENVNDYERISIRTMARHMTSNQQDEDRLYNRLKKSIPKFFDHQSRQTHQIADRKIEYDGSGGKYRTKISYKLYLFHEIRKLFSLPMNTKLVTIQAAIERVVESCPILESPQKREKQRDPDKEARAAIKKLEDVEHLAGSPEAAAIHLLFADVNGTLQRLVQEIKGESPMKMSTKVSESSSFRINNLQGKKGKVSPIFGEGEEHEISESRPGNEHPNVYKRAA